jgi:carbamoyl-phosphate synthase large subunit
MTRIAITSVGSLVGHNILEALEGRRHGIEIIGINSDAAAAGNFRCERAYLAPPAASEAAYLERLSAILLDERPDLVLPGRDDDVLALALLKESSATLRPALAVGPSIVAAALNDKWASRDFAVRHSLPFVDTACADEPTQVERLVDAHGFPLIAKPRRGNGSRGVRIIFDQAQCAAVRQFPGYLLQPYLEPEADLAAWRRLGSEGTPLFHAPTTQQIACQSVIDAEGRVRGVFCTHVHSVAGRPQRVVWLDDPDVNSAAQRYAEKFANAGWVGTLNLQGRRDRAGAFRVYELNGRFTGGTTARTRLGFDEVGLLIECFVHRALPPPAGVADRQAIVVKSPADWLLLPDAIRHLEIDQRWQRDAAGAPLP